MPETTRQVEAMVILNHNTAQQVQNPLSEMLVVKCASKLRSFWILKDNSVFYPAKSGRVPGDQLHFYFL